MPGTGHPDGRRWAIDYATLPPQYAPATQKNSLFYKTLNGARVGDLFMSLIHICELNGANPFDYLTELQRHAEELKRNPSEWMPWNYRETLARLARAAAA